MSKTIRIPFAFTDAEANKFVTVLNPSNRLFNLLKRLECETINDILIAYPNVQNTKGVGTKLVKELNSSLLEYQLYCFTNDKKNEEKRMNKFYNSLVALN